MAKKIRVPEKVLPNIALLAEHADKLSLLQQVTDGMEPGKQTPASIATAFASKANIPLISARAIVTQAMSLHDLRISFSMKPSELFDALTESLENEASVEWKAINLEKWKSARSIVEKVVDPKHPLSSIYKSVRLSYEHQNVLYSAAIITDIRPVFDDAAREVTRMTIAHVLEVEFSDGDERRKLFAALDATDIAKLKSSCERAETKAATLKEKMKVLPWPVVISGEFDDE